MSRWSDALSKQHQCRRGNKYRAQRCEAEDDSGRSFPSKLERAVYAKLKLMERAGEIENIRFQVKIELIPGHMTHNIDFVVFDKRRGIDVGIEAKGKEDQTWREKRKVYKAVGPFPVQIWGGHYLAPKLMEEIPAGRYRVVEK